MHSTPRPLCGLQTLIVSYRLFISLLLSSARHDSLQKPLAVNWGAASSEEMRQPASSEGTKHYVYGYFKETGVRFVASARWLVGKSFPSSFSLPLFGNMKIFGSFKHLHPGWVHPPLPVRLTWCTRQVRGTSERQCVCVMSIQTVASQCTPRLFHVQRTVLFSSSVTLLRNQPSEAIANACSVRRKILNVIL